MKKNKILLAGAGGMVGSALSRLFKKNNYRNVLAPKRREVDFTVQLEVREYIRRYAPDVIIVAAAKVGGILANFTYPAEFLFNNLMIAANIIHEAHGAGVDRLLFLGSTCIYPKDAPQPISEKALLTGSLESTNEAYALAKIAGIKLCEYYNKQYGRKYISAMPTNLYGFGDNYHLNNAHVLPALLRKFHEAKEKGEKEAFVWGSGNPKREFLHVDDLAEAILFLLENYEGSEPINVGSQDEMTIGELAEKIASVVDFKGSIAFDLSKPDGVARKKSDSSKILSMGWKAKIPFEKGLKMTYQDFLSKKI